MIRLTINGEEQEFPDATPLSEYVTSLGVNPKMIAVAYNGEVAATRRMGRGHAVGR